MSKERFQKLLNDFCKETGCEIRIIHDSQYQGNLLKVNGGAKQYYIG